MDIQEQLNQALQEVERLKKENIQLKKELYKAQGRNTLSSPAFNLMKKESGFSPKEKAAITLFMNLFRGRADVFAQRWESNTTGKSGYSPGCENEWDKKLCQKPKIKCQDCSHRLFNPLTPKVIYEHLIGKKTIGIYPLLEDNSCYFLALDFDKKEWQEDVHSFIKTCKDVGLPYHIERSRSGEGAHVWFFFENAISASLARKLGMTLLSRTREKRFEIGVDSFDRMFPNQDVLPQGGFGNLIALPLQKQARNKGNSVFVNDSFEEYKNQWQYLFSIKKISEKEILKITKNFSGGENYMKIKEEVENFNLPKELTIKLNRNIQIPKNLLPSKILNELQKLAIFSNPEFFKAQAKRSSTHRIPKLIDCTQIEGNMLMLPRGLLEKVKEVFAKYKIALMIQSEQFEGKSINVKFHGQLSFQQEDAITSMVKYDNGVLAAEPGFGKTVTAAALISRNETNTLIIVHRTQLVEQWKERLSTFLNIPVKEIGQIGGGKNKPTYNIDVATIQALNRKGAIKPELHQYGQIIVDECHHISAVSFEKVLDGLHPIIFMQCGPIRYKTNNKKQANIRPFKQTLVQRETLLKTNEADIQAIYSLLSTNKERNDIIFNDVLQALDEKRSPIVLTERLDHINELYKLFKGFAKNIIILSGAMKKKERQQALEKLMKVPDSEERLLIATGKYVGEGFDDSRLDTLFLTMPISWKGTLQQYVGRLHRNHSDKNEVKVFDYVDSNVDVLQRMFEKRLKGYKNSGYSLQGEIKEGSRQIQLF
ncbi:type III restriction endonuclease subunit R [Alkalihalobacillus alcalophilus ATCC 27647 = CGMCC 1.3604]|uniref:Restriction endonuclease subunit R n=1 Tax=Alkalihalobacillus alcalophilus ATCC 27647 = CGMCC 1.3604 TaxID=1218173 RepID=A0A094YTI5_ALKAL|nr:DEAD/DEAH box helicase [Alkalihalobacillus alcalophilus]KGA96752.1 restriction endonuclease subunit R [Alkalihalobacillus alcalophilus ATCC 27647 = CGMCC 1.3604]MED1563826.1 DEAD/DEAH box helicase family protein [Alkalihalobacillus alcalophilus]THG92131.1 type III restriction endonuclease subunit R [Alkalihalobacillus alcalophilus ATCC 27647 = CGMCC 1.3604]